jgi:hypothetical protein
MADIPSDEARRSAEEVSRAAREAAVALQKQAEAAAQAKADLDQARFGLQQVGQGLISFTRSVTDGSGGMSKYSGAVNSTADGLADLSGALLGPLGTVIGLFIKVVGKLVGSVLETNDKVIDGYDKLAAMGGATQFSAEGLRDLAIQAKWNISSGAYTQLVDVITEFGSNVTGLGNTAGLGIQNFMKITRVEENVRDEFTRLGLSQKKVAQLQASYLAQEIKTGTARYKTNEMLRKESFAYIRNLIEISSLTGESIDVIKKKREEDLRDIGYNLALQEKAKQKDGTKLVEKLKNAVDLAGEVDSTSRKAVMDVITRGQAIGPAAAALEQRFAQAGMSFTSSVKELEKGDIDLDEFRLRMQKAILATNERQGQNMRIIGQESANIFGISAETQAYLSKLLGKDTSKIVKQQVEEAAKRKDSLKETQIAIQDATTALSAAFDEFIKLISGPVNAAFRGLMYAFKALSTGILKFLTRFKQLFGFDEKKIDPKLPYMFDSVEELLDQQKKANSELTRIKKIFAEKGIKQKPESLSEVSWKHFGLIGEQYAYQEAQKTLEGVNAQIKTLMSSEEFKKQLAAREKNQSDTSAKEKALTEAEKQQKDARAAKEKSQSSSTTQAPSAPVSSGSVPTLDALGNIVVTESQGQSTNAPAGVTPQKFMRGGIAQNPTDAKRLVGNLGGNAKIPLPSGIDIPADVSLSEDLLAKLASMQSSSKPNNDVQAMLQDAMKNIQVDAVPANFDIGRKDLLKDTDNMNNIMGSYTETLKKTIDNTIKLPEKTTRQSNNVNDILAVIVEKMDILASRMNENTEVQYSALLGSRR